MNLATRGAVESQNQYICRLLRNYTFLAIHTRARDLLSSTKHLLPPLLLFFLPASRLLSSLLVSSPLNPTLDEEGCQGQQDSCRAVFKVLLHVATFPAYQLALRVLRRPVTLRILTVTPGFPLSLHHLRIFWAGCQIEHISSRFGGCVSVGCHLCAALRTAWF